MAKKLIDEYQQQENEFALAVKAELSSKKRDMPSLISPTGNEYYIDENLNIVDNEVKQYRNYEIRGEAAYRFLGLKPRKGHCLTFRDKEAIIKKFADFAQKIANLDNSEIPQSIDSILFSNIQLKVFDDRKVGKNIFGPKKCEKVDENGKPLEEFRIKGESRPQIRYNGDYPSFTYAADYLQNPAKIKDSDAHHYKVMLAGVIMTPLLQQSLDLLNIEYPPNPELAKDSE